MYTKDIVAEFKNDQWLQLANLNQGRYGHGSITIGGQAMIIGGYFNGQTLVKLFSAIEWKNLLQSLFSPLVTEVWEFDNGNDKIIEPTLPDWHYSYGIALYVVEQDFCKLSSWGAWSNCDLSANIWSTCQRTRLRSCLTGCESSIDDLTQTEACNDQQCQGKNIPLEQSQGILINNVNTII